MGKITLRPYQEKIIQETRNHFISGRKSVLVQSPTGSGKTITASEMLRGALTKNKRCFFACHRKELIAQTVKSLYSLGINSEVISAGYPKRYRHPMQVCSIQTLYRRKEGIIHPDFIMFDEAHYIKAQTWKAVFDHYPEAYKVLLTATPIRSDGKGFGDVAEVMVRGPSVKELIAQGSLSDYKMYAPSTIDMTGVKKSMGDFQIKETEQRLATAKITGSAIKEYQRRLSGGKALIFCVSIRHSMAVVDEFNRAGIPAVHLDGETDYGYRAKSLERFSKGEIKIVSNVGLFSEGVDVPSLDGVIMLRPTMSLALYLQQVGRALRPHPDKDYAIILDHVGNYERHGLPDDDREWSLEAPAKNKKGNGNNNGPPIRICEKCFAAQPPVYVCKYCLHPFPIKEREIEEVEGDLEEINKEQARRIRKREQSQAKTLEDLIELGKSRGYKHPVRWAEYLFNARNSRK